MSNRPCIYCILFLAGLLYGCEIHESHPEDDEIPVSGRRTVLVYLGADNNFRAEAAEKIEQLRSGWQSSADGNLLVYSDTGEKPVLIHIYHSNRQGNVADTLHIDWPENSANPQTLARVLDKMQTDWPALSYGMVVLSHATGWLPAKMSVPPALRSIILDRSTEESNNYMELGALAEAIPYKLDFVVFDACFMGSIEVAYELKDKTDYIVASPAEVLSPGFVYSSMMQHLFAPQPDLTAVAREFYEYYNNQSGLFRSATVSVVKTSGLEMLSDWTKVMYNATSPWEETKAKMQCFGYGSQKIYFDFGDYIQKRFPEQYDAFQSTLNNCIIYKAHTPSYYSEGTRTLQPIDTFSGLSTYIPQAAYPEANERYKQLKWAQKMNK